MNITAEAWTAVAAAAKAGLADINARADILNAKRANSWDLRWGPYEVSEFEVDGYSVIMVIDERDRRDNRGIARDPKTGKVFRVKYIRRGGGRREMQWEEPLKRWSKLEGKSADEIAAGVGLLNVWMDRYIARVSA